MAKRKQQQDAVEGDTKSIKLEPGSEKETTLPSFWTLPEEIRAYIFRLVCARTAQDEAEANASTEGKDPTAAHLYGWRVDLDVKTVRRLTLVSQHFYAYFNPLLFAHVRLAKPSALAQFHAGLLSRPSNGLLVQSMHIGPLDYLHEDYWPLKTVNCEDASPGLEAGEESASCFITRLYFRSGLTALEDELRPRWCEGDQEFAYLETPKHARDRATYEAIAAAVEAVDVATDLDCLYSNREGEFIGIVEWTKRLYDAQGALDLYLCHMRQIEDTRSSIDESFKGYPRLAVEGFDEGKQTSNEAGEENDVESRRGTSAPASNHALVPSSKDGNAFVVKREQIRAHHSRPGAHTDHFDHPLVFAREDLRCLATNEWGEVKIDEDQAVYFEEQNYRVEDRENERASHSLFPQWHDGAPALGRLVLRLTPHVKNLSLTGLFHDCLGSAMLPVLSQIRYLSVGPLTPHTHASLCIRDEATMLPAVKKLRVCGNFPGIGAAMLIGGEGEGLPSLQEAYWDFGHTDARSIGGGGEDFLWKMLNIMRGADETTEQYGPTKDHQPPCRYVEARLHPNLITAMLSKARTPEICAALSEGLPASDALRPLRIVQSRASSEERHWKSSSQRFDVLRQEGQDWWKERAIELERSERQREGA